MKKVLVYFAFIIALGIGALGFMNALKSSFNESEYEVINYTVESGDTLWNLGLQFKAEYTDVRDWIEAVKMLNGINADLSIGQNIQVYVEK